VRQVDRLYTVCGRKPVGVVTCVYKDIADAVDVTSEGVVAYGFDF
jgi:hypothetical protein